jgi:hypothetical protein
MATVLSISLLAGAILALRFRVFVLVAANLAAIVGAAIFAALLGAGAWTSIFLAVLALETGYLAMTALRFVIAPPKKHWAGSARDASDLAY